MINTSKNLDMSRKEKGVQPPKILFVATVSRFVSGFLKAQVAFFLSKGWVVHVASHGEEAFPEGVTHFEVGFSRSPLALGNLKAVLHLRRIISRERYNIVSCHTPVGGAAARLACFGLRKSLRTKVVYTPHGFHFFKGASLKNWLFYFPAEWIFAAMSDALITIVDEDYRMAKAFRFPCQKIYCTKGIGIDTERLDAVRDLSKKDLRREYGIPDDAIVLVYAAEFIARKNHELIIRATPALKEKFPNLRILFAGRGVLEDEMKHLVESLGCGDIISFLGFRRDLPKLLKCSDVGISSSRQEGLPMNLAEEMWLGLPIIASNVRGNRDLVEDGVSGFLFESEKQKGFFEKAEKILSDESSRVAMGERGRQIATDFTTKNVMRDVARIYAELDPALTESGNLDDESRKR